MPPTHSAWTPSSLLLAATGFSLIVAGLYFLLMRPGLLPEDIRYMNLSAGELAAVRPRLEVWLGQVFRVMGGYVLATGVLAVTLAVTSFRAHDGVAAIGALIGGGASIGLMAAVNFAIGSDFKWVLLAMMLLWAASFVAYWFETGSPHGDAAGQKSHVRG